MFADTVNANQWEVLFFQIIYLSERDNILMETVKNRAPSEDIMKQSGTP